MAVPTPLRTARFAAGRLYATLWRALDDALARVAPASVRRERALPRLPPAPVHRKYGLRIGPPVDRVYIERFLASRSADIHGRVLEILDPIYTQRFGGSAVTQADVLDLDADNPQATVVGDFVTGAGVPRDAFDCFICTQTLSLIHDTRAAVDGAWRLLAPGGVLLLTVPGISQQADPDAEAFPDHWRFTKRSVTRLLADRFGAENVAVHAEGTVAASAAFLYGIPAADVDPLLLDPHDPDYEMVVCARAVKGTA